MGNVLKWDSNYDLGHKKIDEQHRIFFGLITEFQEAITNGAANDKLLRMLDIILKYAEFHFASEEEIMTEHQYPAQPQHANLHIILLEEVKDIFDQFKQDKLGTIAVSEFLLNWFLLHISRQDKKLVGFIGQTI